jgi:hypothetical protein
MTLSGNTGGDVPTLAGACDRLACRIEFFEAQLIPIFSELVLKVLKAPELLP